MMDKNPKISFFPRVRRPAVREPRQEDPRRSGRFINVMRYAGLTAYVIRTDIETKTNNILVQCKTTLNVVLRPESS